MSAACDWWIEPRRHVALGTAFCTALGLGIPSLKWILLFPGYRKETEAQSGVVYRSQLSKVLFTVFFFKTFITQVI